MGMIVYIPVAAQFRCQRLFSSEDHFEFEHASPRERFNGDHATVQKRASDLGGPIRRFVIDDIRLDALLPQMLQTSPQVEFFVVHCEERDNLHGYSGIDDGWVISSRFLTARASRSTTPPNSPPLWMT